MKFLVDAQLPKKMAYLSRSKGFDVKHTLDLQEANKTKDTTINQITIEEKRVLVSKDLDFVESLLISDKPYKLICVATGNITNKKLLDIFENNLPYMLETLQDARYIELSTHNIITKL